MYIKCCFFWNLKNISSAFIKGVFYLLLRPLRRVSVDQNMLFYLIRRGHEISLRLSVLNKWNRLGRLSGLLQSLLMRGMLHVERCSHMTIK